MTQSSATFPIHSILDASHSQCQMMTEDMQRLNQIINDAIPAIINSFNTMYECMEKQGVLSKELLGGEKVATPHIAHWKQEYKALEGESAKSLDQVLIALQFQDMVNQLTQNMVKRLTIMQDIFQETVSDVMPAYSEIKGVAFAIHDSIEQRISLLNELTFKTPVAQESMEAGDIDLF
jgi:hypothetical protein